MYNRTLKIYAKLAMQEVIQSYFMPGRVVSAVCLNVVYMTTSRI